MSYKTGSDLESQLRELDLASPPESLDEKIGELAKRRTIAMASVPETHTSRTGWSALISMGLAAGLLAIIVGYSLGLTEPSLPSADNGEFTNAINIQQVAQFEALHGHSGNPEYSNCSDCHQFAAPEDQQVETWKFEHAKTLGIKCSLCHQESVPPEDGNPHALVEQEAESFDNLHGHSSNEDYASCSDCHQFAEPKDQKVEAWKFEHDLVRGTNCSLCHVAETPNNAPAKEALPPIRS